MTYFDSEFVQFFALGAGAGLLLGLLLGWLLRGARTGRAGGAQAGPVVPAVEVVAAPSDAPALHHQPLTALPGITGSVVTKLTAQGIANVGGLWQLGQDDERLLELADAAQVEDFAVRRWVALADLARVDGIDFELGDALLRLGIRSSTALAQANPDRVQNKLAAAQAGVKTAAVAPDRATVVALIERAGSV